MVRSMSETMDEWQAIRDEIDQQRGLDDPDRLLGRIGTLERIERLLFERSGAHRAPADDTIEHARELQACIEAENEAFYAQIRDEIRRGGPSRRLRAWLPAFAACARRGAQAADCYDALDDLASGILQPPPPSVDARALADEMVFYQPTPARHIFDLIDRTALSERDVLVDLGSGMGHVPLLVAACTPARTIGIEIEPAYVDCARRCAADLNLARATFVAQDARDADLISGTLFYLYTPFSGSILRAVLDALAAQARERPIRVCTFGPCVARVAQERWLDAVDGVDAQRICMFRSRPR